METTIAKEVATTILQQLGGNKFLAMTGARTMIFDKNGSLSFRLANRFAKNGINYVCIALDPTDTYTVEFGKIGNKPKYQYTVVAKHHLVYCDQLPGLFEMETGLHVRL